MTQRRGKTTDGSNGGSFASAANTAPESSLDNRAASIDRVLQRYSADLDRLADYDRGTLTPGPETLPSVALDITDVETIVSELRERYPDDSRLGLAKDESMHSVLGQIEQTFMGEDLYASAEEKAANLLYMVVKDHPFHDGNKRTAAALFAYYLDRNNVDLDRVPGNMLTALVLIAAAGDPARKDETVTLIRSLLEAR